MSVIIKEVKNKRDLKKWAKFPSILYKDNEYFVPFLLSDEINTFTKSKNPAYEYCDSKLFLAYKDNKIVGRIALIINHAYNKKWNKKAIRFTRFDFVDDIEVSKALFDEVIKWAKENNLNTINGPIGFHDMDHEGMLIEGFEELNMSITFYNYKYYIDHYEKLGLKKDVDWVEYKLTYKNDIDPKFDRVSSHIMKRNGYKLITYTNRKVLKRDAYEAFKVIDVAFDKLYGTVPLTDKVIDDAIKNYISIVNLKYICSVKDKDDKIVGFAVLVPSIAKALKKSSGKLFPFGIFRLLKALNGKNDTLEMFFVAVDPSHQKKGLPGIIINHILKVIKENNILYAETGPELETNEDVQNLWKSFDAKNHKRRRCFIKEI